MNAKDTIDVQIGFGMDLSIWDAEEMLGAKIKDGLCEINPWDVSDKELFYNIERTFGTYVKSAVTKGISDCWGLDIHKPVLENIRTYGSYRTQFYVRPMFTTTLTFNSTDAAEQFSDDDLKLVINEIAKSLPSDMLIETVAVNKA